LHEGDIHEDQSQLIGNTSFGLTHEGWVMWACLMGLWTVIQALLNAHRHDNAD
jgi:hypothetical protein